MNKQNKSWKEWMSYCKQKKWEAFLEIISTMTNFKNGRRLESFPDQWYDASASNLKPKNKSWKWKELKRYTKKKKKKDIPDKY